jgi:hypothetical protein
VRRAVGGDRRKPTDDRAGRTSSIITPETDSPGRDAALACGNDRVYLIRALAARVPDDVAAAAAETGGGDGGWKTQSDGKKNTRVVGAFGVKDVRLFEAALGIGGFDERFEAKVRLSRGNAVSRRRPGSFLFFFRIFSRRFSTAADS